MKQQKSAWQMMLLAFLLLIPILAGSVKTIGQGEAKETESASTEKWEYLVVAGANRTNFSPTGNPRMRKEPQGSFGIEAFVLEQQLDKLGADGWELVSVAGSPVEPIYYFKRRK